MTTPSDMRHLRRKADNVLKSLAEEPDVTEPSPPEISDDSDRVWFERLEEQTSKEIGYPTPVKTPGGRSYDDVERYRHSLPKVADPLREEITGIVHQFFMDGPEAIEPDPSFKTQYGIEYIGGGSFRRVYGFTEDTALPIMRPGGVVLKVAERMEWTNKEEARIWAKFSGTELAPKLAPVIDIGPEGHWILMKRVDTNNHPGEQKINEVREEIEEAGWNYHDMKSDNFGWNENDEPVLVDYGYDWSERDEELMDV